MQFWYSWGWNYIPVAGQVDMCIDQMEEDHETLWVAEQLAAAVTVPAVCFPRATLPVPWLFRGKEFILFGGGEHNRKERILLYYFILFRHVGAIMAHVGKIMKWLHTACVDYHYTETWIK